MKFKNYQLNDFLADQEFKKWVLHPEKDDGHFWERYIQANPHQKETIKEAWEIISAMKFEKYDPSEEQYSTVLSNILSGKKALSTSPEIKSKYRIGAPSTGLWYKIAASIVLLLTATALWYFNQNAETDKIPLIAANVVKQNPKGQKSTIMLPDGTKVTLNAESSLTFPSRFDSLHRKVILKGEAFFDVVKDPNRPFIVVSDRISTTVLGTSFNIRSYDDEPDINVSLRTGKVMVESQFEGQQYREELFPGEKIIHNKAEDSYKKELFDESEELGWKDGLLVFNDVDLPHFVKTLERWYGVEFQVIGDKKEQWHIEGRFDNESLKEILEGLTFTYNIGYELHEDTVKLILM